MGNSTGCFGTFINPLRHGVSEYHPKTHFYGKFSESFFKAQRLIPKNEPFGSKSFGSRAKTNLRSKKMKIEESQI